MDWQPIETAPRDGTQILIADAKLFTRAFWQITKWLPEGGWSHDNPVAFDEEDSQLPDYDGSFPSITPTHWRHRLAPPAPRQGRG